MFRETGDYSVSHNWLHSKLLGEKPDSLRLILEHTNMMLFDLGGDGFLTEEKTIISLFRMLMSFDSDYEHLNALDIERAKTCFKNITIEEVQKKQKKEWK